jgi:chromosome segregation ATPase
MKRNQAAPAGIATDWQEVIEKVQEVLAQTESEAAARARILDSAPASATGVTPVLPAEEKVSAWKQGLERYEERMQGFQASLQQAEQNLQESEASLLEAEEGINQWIEAAGARRKKLEEEIAKD